MLRAVLPYLTWELLSLLRERRLFHQSCYQSIQSLSHVWLFSTPWIAARQASLSITNPRVYSHSRPLGRWCHPAISSSVIPFFCPQSLPASGSFPMSQLFTWGGQCTGISASASVCSMNTQDWFPLGWTTWISLQSKGLSRVFSNTTVQKHQYFNAQLSSHPYMTAGKTIALTRQTFVGKGMSLLLNMLSRLVITFLSRSKHLLIPWL